MSVFKKFLKYVDEGREGLNKGIPMGFPRLDKYLRGLQRKKYYLIGSVTGTGKTSFIDEAFILNPYKYIKQNNIKESLKIFYYSFEIDLESKLAKWVSYQIFQDTGKEIDPEKILGMDMQHETDTENRLSDEDYNLVIKYTTYFDELFGYIQFEDVPINPTGIYNQVKKYMEENGKWIEYERIVEGKPKKIKYFKPNNSNEYVEIIIDHIGLTKKELKYNKKDNIDKLDEYLISLRNAYGCIPIVVSQFNRDMADINRQRFKELTPLLEDFKDSGNTQESANVVIGIFHPKRYNIDTYQDYFLKGNGYNILDVFRCIFILKNRGGRDGMKLALRFLGICGYFEEIPTAEEFNNNVEWYKKVADFSKPFLELIKEKKK